MASAMLPGERCHYSAVSEVAVRISVLTLNPLYRRMIRTGQEFPEFATRRHRFTTLLMPLWPKHRYSTPLRW